MSSEDNILVKAENLKKYFISGGVLERLFKKEYQVVKAVDGIDLSIEKGEIHALVGESGSGKTTTGRLLLRLIEPTEGRIIFKDIDITSIPEKRLRRYRPNMQIIFQDPYSSLNPRMRVKDIILEPLRFYPHRLRRRDRLRMLIESLEMVRLTPPEDFIMKYPHQLSGGQRQRVSIARAIITRPEFLVADEPVSMIDVSVRAGILNTLLKIKEQLNLTMLFITHDLPIATRISDRISVMYLGNIVELGKTSDIKNKPLHPYTKLLFSSIPRLGEKQVKEEIQVSGEPPSPANPPSGCKFHPRCPFKMEKCSREAPKLIEIENGRLVACHLFS